MDQQDNFFVYLLTERLPIETRKTWETSTPGREPQRYNQLKKFLEKRCQALETSSLRSTSFGNLPRKILHFTQKIPNKFQHTCFQKSKKFLHVMKNFIKLFSNL